MSDFYFPIATKKGEAVRYGDSVKLTSGYCVKAKGMCGEMLEHSQGFSPAEHLAEIVERVALIPATFHINSAHFTNDKPDGVCWNLKIPVMLTGKKQEIVGHLSGTRHYEVLFADGKVYWIHEYSLILPEPFETERMRRDFPEEYAKQHKDD
jgi:hypothetical protein